MNARDTNRSRIEALYRALNAADIDGVMACYGEGARIEVVAPGPFEGEHAPSRDLLERLFQAIPELTFEIRSLLFDGNCVAAEVSSTGKLANGAPYSNRYHNLFELRDGLIVNFREYPTYPGAESSR